jgi:hypothetical protein
MFYQILLHLDFCDAYLTVLICNSLSNLYRNAKVTLLCAFGYDLLLYADMAASFNPRGEYRGPTSATGL